MTRTPLDSRKIIGFGDEHEVVDFTIDDVNRICYAVTIEGVILGASLSIRSKIKVNFIYNKDKRRNTLAGLVRKKKSDKFFTSINVSRDGKILVTSSSKRIDENFVKNEVFVFKLKGEEEPESMASHEIVTQWKGSKK